MKKDINVLEEAFVLEEKRHKQKVCYLICILALFVAAFVCIIIGELLIRSDNYNKVLNNPPENSWIEKDLEPILMTDNVVVYETINKRENIYYKVNANNLQYKVHYAIEQDFNVIDFSWVYQRHVQIKEELKDE